MSSATRDVLLALNAGSSSIKFALFERDSGAGDPALLVRGRIEDIQRTPRFVIDHAHAEPIGPLPSGARLDAVSDHASALDLLLDWLELDAGGLRLRAAGHRVVHGGADFTDPVTITPEVLDALSGLVPLAPQHQPHNVAAIRALAARLPGLAQVACFDTAFHTTQPWVATVLPLPRDLRDKGLRRYGFHGLSYEYVAGVLPAYTAEHRLPGRTVIAHLGNGASMCAIKDGRSVATTMGFSTLDGTLMGTRCGAIDPGVLLYLLREEGLDLAALTDLLYNRSGLLGVSGVSGDMRRLLASDRPEAARAVDLFCYRVVRELGSLAAALGGLDALVFTGGIGERAAPVRAAVCREAAWLGLDLDEAANADDGPLLSTADSPVRVWVIPTNEELVIARHTRNLVAR